VRGLYRLHPRSKTASGDGRKKHKAARVMRRSKGFILVDCKLYRRGTRSGVLMKCVTREDIHDILREIHEGVCGHHAASRTLDLFHQMRIKGKSCMCDSRKITTWCVCRFAFHG
jgi:hypothetical protein